MFSEPSPAVRARIIRTFASILKVDPDLIARENIKDAVTERFNDVGISVREEAVKLVGVCFVQQGYDLSEGYLG